MSLGRCMLGLCLVCILEFASPHSFGAPPAPKSPEDSLKAIQLRPGMQVDLVASEPLVGDPIAIAWGADGRMWVVEMGDYPLGVDGKGAPGGCVKILEDTNGDGRYDVAKTFLDGLGFPTGVMPWRKGALITCAPEIFYAEDTDGDGKADRREVLFSGFPERNQQHRVNGLQWGLDNWVHCANGDGGVGGATVIECRKRGSAKIELGGRDFRFNPDTGELDPQTGTTQFGRNRDDWGRWFGSNNAQPLYHFVLADEYLRRNPFVVPPDPRTHLLTTQGPFFALAPNVPIRGEHVYPTKPPYRVSLGGPCSGMIYRDNLLGPEFTGNAFVCDPVTNLVHREVLEPHGATFRSHRAADETTCEFFASRDSWTRPTMARTGPDGALWIVDMYRLVIEHPQWISPKAKQQLDLRAGHDMGRIYRVWPEKTRPRPIKRLDQLDVQELVAALDTPNGWQRDTAQQLLLWKASADAVAPLEQLARTSANPLARLHALCTLAGLDRLDPTTLIAALADKNSEVRCQAVRLLEPLLRAGKAPMEKLTVLARDVSPQVRQQLACSIGDWHDPRAIELLVQLGGRGNDDVYLNAAVLSSIPAEQGAQLLSGLLQLGAPPPHHLVCQAAALSAVTDSPEGVSAMVALIDHGHGKNSAWQYAAMAAWFDARDRIQRPSPGLRQRAESVFFAARMRLDNIGSEQALRIAAIELLGRDGKLQMDELRMIASAMIHPRYSPDVHSAALERLARIDHLKVPELLMEGLPNLSPAQRSRALDVLLSRDHWAVELMTAIVDGIIAASEIDAPHRQRMREHKSVDVSGPAKRLFVEKTSDERKKLIEIYRAGLAAAGNPELGKATFEKRCSVCHRIGDVGKLVGPDLTGYANKPDDEWLIAILDPNRAVEPRYNSYTVTTNRGQTVSGILSAETAISLTLLAADGRPQTVLRTDIDALRGTGKSLMPEGLERDLTTADLANLLAFVRSIGRRPR